MKTQLPCATNSLVCQTATEHPVPSSLGGDDQCYLLILHGILSSSSSPQHKLTESRCADRSRNGRQGHTAHTDSGSWAASTQQLFHIIGFKWYLCVEVLGVTSLSPLEAVGELLGHNVLGSHRAGATHGQVWDICVQNHSAILVGKEF